MRDVQAFRLLLLVSPPSLHCDSSPPPSPPLYGLCSEFCSCWCSPTTCSHFFLSTSHFFPFSFQPLPRFSLPILQTLQKSQGMSWGAVTAPAKPRGSTGHSVLVNLQLSSHLQPTAWFLTFHPWHRMGPAGLIRGIYLIPLRSGSSISRGFALGGPAGPEEVVWVWVCGRQLLPSGPFTLVLSQAASPLEGSSRPLPCAAAGTGVLQ